MDDWLIGKQRHTIDSKNRTFIPAKFRAKLGDIVYLTKSFNNECLCLYSREGFRKFKDEIIEKLPKIKGAAAISWLGRNSEELTVDGQGRIALPGDYRKFAHLETNIVSSGAFDCVEIWDEATFDQKDAEISFEEIRALMMDSENKRSDINQGNV